MPSHRVHRAITTWVLGKHHGKVHKAIDYPYKFLGSKHRILFHDPLTSVLVARVVSKEKDASSAAILHVLTDLLFPSRASKVLDSLILLRRRIIRLRFS
jgi:hypothetical protein